MNSGPDSYDAPVEIRRGAPTPHPLIIRGGNKEVRRPGTGYMKYLNKMKIKALN